MSRTPGQVLEVRVGPDEILPAQVALLPLYSAANATEQAAALHHRAVEVFSQGHDDEAADVLQRGIEVASRRGDLMPLREMEHRLTLGHSGP